MLAQLVLAPGAGAHRDPCHARHGCPSDHHTYAWRGLSCTSYADERLPADTRRVVSGGPLPDPVCTPGAVLRGVTETQVCAPGWASCAP